MAPHTPMPPRETPQAPARNAEIDRNFAAALELPAEPRLRFLARLRQRDPEVAAAVEKLLESALAPGERFATGHCLEGPVWDELASDDPGGEPPADPTGVRVGAYRILGELGRGGMSVVYLAERADRLFEHRVALKFLEAVGEIGLRRFEQERQILATLNHPGIARLLDGRVDDQGRPYIVMELVEGRPVDRYCHEEDLDLEGRLELFGQIAAAVEYAHRNLVVHRDLKPSNILVTGDGRVKLLDFGIAKLLGPGAAGDFAAPPTRAAAQVLTPEYASPEQVLGERITTSSDVYQLGLLLYELLAGRRPFDLDGVTAADVQRVVCEKTPDRPSLVVATREFAAPSDDGLPPAAPARRLKGDLDNIVLRALEKEPERRYASVGELREDLERFRQGLPVMARPPTLAYRASRYLRRNLSGVVAAVAVVALLVGYAVTVTVQNRRVAAEAAKTERVKEFLESLFVQANPGVNKGTDPTATALVEAGASRVAVELEDQPAIQAEMMTLLGSIYATLGRYDEAARQLSPALVILRRLHGPVHEDVARTAQRLATVLHYDGRYRESERLLREVLTARRSLFGTESREVGETLNDLGDLLHSQGELPRAERVLRLTLRIQRSAMGDESHEVARAQRDLANALRDRGAFEEAEPLYRRSLAISRARLGAVDPVVARTQNELARLLAETGAHREAEDLLREDLSVYAVLYPSGHPMEGTTYRNLGLLRLREGRPVEARRALERALANYERTFTEANAFIPRAERFLAEALLASGDPDSAAVVAERAVARLRALGLSRHPAVTDGLETLGLARLEQGRPAESVELLGQALSIREAMSVPEDSRLQVLRDRLQTAAARAGGTRAGPAEEQSAELAPPVADRPSRGGLNRH